jgi:hypothetical protein
VQDAVEQFEVGDLVVRILYDEDGSSSNPREDWDMLCEMVGWHRRYDIGDRKPNPDEENAMERGGWKLLKRWLELHGAIATTKIGMYDHSGITIYPVSDNGNGHGIGDNAGWDSGVVGFAFVTRKQWKLLMGDSDPKEMIDDEEQVGFGRFPVKCESAYKHMYGEMDVYDSWLKGEVYGFTVTRPHAECGKWQCSHSEVLDSAWGFVGDSKSVVGEARASAQYFIDNPTATDR